MALRFIPTENLCKSNNENCRYWKTCSLPLVLISMPSESTSFILLLHYTALISELFTVKIF
jgi:hypothetical protein